jgi:hypothetical protein
VKKPDFQLHGTTIHTFTSYCRQKRKFFIQ